MNTPDPNQPSESDELDKILIRFFNEAEADVHSSNNSDGVVITKSHTRAKQAITSLIKELVAEAKPEEYEDYYATDPVEKGHKMGYNEAVREFEQNLLKALEEV